MSRRNSSKASAKISKQKALRRFPSLRTDAKDDIGKPAQIIQLTPQIARAINRGMRLDSWENVINGLGRRGQDPRTAGRAAWNGLLSETEAEQLYAGDELARRLAELPPRECLKNWIKFDGLEEYTTRMEEELYRLRAPQLFFEAAVWARVYGGSALLMATGEDPDLLKEPLDPLAINRVESLVLFSRHELLVRSTDLETDINSPNYGKPKYYWLTPRKGNVNTLFSVRIHHSRLIRFDGKALPLRLNVYNRYWGDSIYTGLIEALRDYGLSHAAMAGVMQEFRVMVYKMKDLADQIASKDGEEVTRRLSKMAATKSALGMFYMDEDETLELLENSFTGVEQMLQALKERLQAYTDIPHIILFNESPGGANSLGQSGSSSLESWYSYLESEQRNYYTPKIDQLILTMLQAPLGPTDGQELPGWDWEFNKIRTMSEDEKATLEQKQLNNTQTRLDMGVDDPWDAMERHNPEKLKKMTVSDQDRMRAALTQIAQAELERQGLGPGGAGVDIPTDTSPLVRERDRVITIPLPPRPDGEKIIADK